MPLKDGQAQNCNEKLVNVPSGTKRKEEDGMYIPAPAAAAAAAAAAGEQKKTECRRNVYLLLQLLLLMLPFCLPLQQKQILTAKHDAPEGRTSPKLKLKTV